MKQEMMQYQCHQPDHKQIICTLLQQITTPAPRHSNFQKPNKLCQSTDLQTSFKQAISELKTRMLPMSGNNVCVKHLFHVKVV